MRCMLLAKVSLRVYCLREKKIKCCVYFPGDDMENQPVGRSAFAMSNLPGNKYKGEKSGAKSVFHLGKNSRSIRINFLLTKR